MRTSGECCGNCEAFMRDRYQDDQGACSNYSEEDCYRWTYPWTMVDGDCPKWEPRKVQEHMVNLADGQMVLEVE